MAFENYKNKHMKNMLLTLIFSLLILSKSFSQDIDTLIFCDYKTVPFGYQYKNTKIEQLSAIEYAGIPGKYFLLPQSKHDLHYFLCTIEEKNEQITWYIDSIIRIETTKFDGEAIRLNPRTNILFFTEERLKKSFLKTLNSNGEIQTLLENNLFQKFNKGWEGLTFDTTFKNLYISVEQTHKKPFTHILKYNLETKKVDTLRYRLDILPDDKTNDNGITEILYCGKNTLLVLERAWQKSVKQTSVRVYKCKINSKKKEVEKIKCIADFNDLYFKADNVEGMTFNADKSKIIFITDDNANKHQQTQIICFKLNPNNSPSNLLRSASTSK